MDTTLNRRELLKAAGVVAVGASLGGCTRTASPARHFAKVKVSPDRVIRTTVGLRPFRTSGFRLEVERFDDKTVVVVGAGEMMKLAVRHMLTLAPGKLWLTNRSADRAKALMDDLGVSPSAGGARPFDDLDQLIVEADIVLTSTGSRRPIITVDRFRPLVRRRDISNTNRRPNPSTAWSRVSNCSAV